MSAAHLWTEPGEYLLAHRIATAKHGIRCDHVEPAHVHSEPGIQSRQHRRGTCSESQSCRGEHSRRATWQWQAVCRFEQETDCCLIHHRPTAIDPGKPHLEGVEENSVEDERRNEQAYRFYVQSRSSKRILTHMVAQWPCQYEKLFCAEFNASQHRLTAHDIHVHMLRYDQLATFWSANNRQPLGGAAGDAAAGIRARP
eukprot:88434-Pleurochrysis_carterae.AAC.1